jgi:hypothetical protein
MLNSMCESHQLCCTFIVSSFLVTFLLVLLPFLCYEARWWYDIPLCTTAPLKAIHHTLSLPCLLNTGTCTHILSTFHTHVQYSTFHFVSLWTMQAQPFILFLYGRCKVNGKKVQCLNFLIFIYLPTKKFQEYCLHTFWNVCPHRSTWDYSL